jgi:hypothetical protein
MIHYTKLCYPSDLKKVKPPEAPEGSGFRWTALPHDVLVEAVEAELRRRKIPLIAKRLWMNKDGSDLVAAFDLNMTEKTLFVPTLCVQSSNARRKAVVGYIGGRFTAENVKAGFCFGELDKKRHTSSVLDVSTDDSRPDLDDYLEQLIDSFKLGLFDCTTWIDSLTKIQLDEQESDHILMTITRQQGSWRNLIAPEKVRACDYQFRREAKSRTALDLLIAYGVTVNQYDPLTQPKRLLNFKNLLLNALPAEVAVV